MPLSSPARADDAAPSPADLADAGPNGDVWLGSEKAPVTIIEYASMTCPHCAHFEENTLPELKKRYIDTGKVHYTLRTFPLDQLAAAGFMIAICGGKD
ncbi:MAG: thioredoxin domain-containing protein, partial [Xanthobacteraceae bacterium]